MAVSVDPVPGAPKRGLPMRGAAIGGAVIALVAVLAVLLSLRPAASTTAIPSSPPPGTLDGAASGARLSPAAPASSTAPTSGLTLNGGAPLVGVAVFRNPQGGCSSYPGLATTPASVRVANGTIWLGFSDFGTQLLNGPVAPDNTYSAATSDGSLKAQGTITLAPTGLRVDGKLSVTRDGCTETVDFDILFGAAANTPGPPPPAFIATNTITFGQAATFDAARVCKEGGTVTFTLKIVGIAPNTPVVEQVTGPGVVSPVTFVMSSNVPATKSFNFPPGGGQWTDAIVTIGGDPPPASASSAFSRVQCIV